MTCLHDRHRRAWVGCTLAHGRVGSHRCRTHTAYAYRKPGQDPSSRTVGSIKAREQDASSTPAVKVVIALQQKLPLQSRVLARLHAEQFSK